MNPKVQAIRWHGEQLALLDQRRLPAQEVWLDIPDIDAAIDAIRELVVRGAPAIGITAAYAAVLAARARNGDWDGWRDDLARLGQARPTAVNLRWAIERMLRCREQGADMAALVAEARNIHEEDIAANRRMAEIGAGLIEPGSGVLTHCNTGGLATGGIGTALGVIVRAHREQRIEKLYADETRPWLQGSRLTAWECSREGVPCELIVEGAAASLLESGRVQWIVTGADRITANGDVANKIGTFNLAVLARHFGARLMVVAPSSTVDAASASGTDIPIESRDAAEIWRAAGLDRPLPGVSAWNPVFDLTPAAFVSVIVTEQGAFEAPFSLARGTAAKTLFML